MQLITDASFSIEENAATHSNATIYLNSVNSEMQLILPSIEINSVLLPSCSPKSNLIKLEFNVIA